MLCNTLKKPADDLAVKKTVWLHHDSNDVHTSWECALSRACEVADSRRHVRCQVVCQWPWSNLDLCQQSTDGIFNHGE